MKPCIRSLQLFIRQIRMDRMLSLFCFLPLLIAVLFRFGVPFLETQLRALLGVPAVLADYYLLFDLFLAVFTPYFLVFLSSMVMLSEIDEHVSAYLAVTPLRKQGYLLSRFLFPAVIAVLVSAVLMTWCTLTRWTLIGILLVCVLAVLLCVPIAMMIVVLSHNRVEGMAVAKLAGLALFGLPVPFFITGGLQYLFAWLPSFWIAKVFVGTDGWAVIPAIVLSLLWIWIFYKWFMRKLL